MINIRKNEGVTLVALVITIIVLLILAGVTISLVINGGIIAQAQSAALETRGAQVYEEVEIWKAERQMIRYSPDGELTGYEEARDAKIEELYDKKMITKKEYNELLSTETTQIGSKIVSFTGETMAKNIFDETGTDPNKLWPGDYVNYSPTTGTFTWGNVAEEGDGTHTYADYSGSSLNPTSITTQTGVQALKWRVLDVKDGRIRLISDEPTNDVVNLGGVNNNHDGANGYNNAVYLLDKVCSKLYSGDKGTATSLRIEDITTHISNFSDTLVKGWGNSEYLNKGINPQYKYYPNILKQEQGQTVNGQTGSLQASKQASPIYQSNANTEASTMSLTCSSWVVAADEVSFKTTMYHDLFVGIDEDLEYWLASRCVEAWSEKAVCGVRKVNSGLDYTYLYSSDNDSSAAVATFRPIVTLRSNITVDMSTGTHNSLGNMYELK